MTASAAKTKSENGKSKNAKMEVQKSETSPEASGENSVLTLEKRIQKVEELNIIIEKWRKLSEARKNMKSFELGNDGLSATITMTDASGREFKTSHNKVASTVIDTVICELDASIGEVEKQINFTA